MASRLFISYSHVDSPLLERLHKHLAQLERDGTVSGWYDREIHAGARLDDEIKHQLEAADVFLACASPDYIASNYCFDKELDLALARESNGSLLIVPVIFEPCEWLETPLRKFKAVPGDGKPVVEHTNVNVALLEIATEIRRLCSQVRSPAQIKSAVSAGIAARRDSRYRAKREFDKLHKLDFVEQAFAEIFHFFEASSQEIRSVPDVEVRLSSRGEDRFSCTVINRGISRGFETLHVRRGGSFGAIDILYGEEDRRNTSNGGFSVVADDYQLYLRPTMFSRAHSEEGLSPRDAAQMLWDDLLSKVGIDYA